MRKKFLSAFMLGLLALGTTSTITSCKDYDDDLAAIKKDIKSLEDLIAQKESTINSSISALQSAIDKANADHATKAALEEAKNTLSAALASETSDRIAKDAELSAAIAKAQGAAEAAAALAQENKTAIEKVASDLATANEKLNTLSADLTAAKAQIGQLEAALEAQVAALSAQDAAILAELEQVKADCEAADAALDAKLAEEIQKVQAEIGNMSELGFDNLVDAHKNNAARIADVEKDIETINGNIGDLYTKYDCLDKLITALAKDLRSLVFMPSLYVDGIEAIEYPYLSATAMNKTASYTLARQHSYESVPVNLSDLVDYEKTNKRVVFGPAWPVDYHMNPSSSSTSFSNIIGYNEREVEVITRAAEGKLGITSPEKYTDGTQLFKNAGGILTAGIQIAHPELLPDPLNATGEGATGNTSYGTDHIVALQVNSAVNGKDTTITSDYAMLYTEPVVPEAIIWTKDNHRGKLNTVDELCPLTTKTVHVFDTPQEALANDPSFDLAWNSTTGIKLSDYIAAHYVRDCVTKAKKMPGTWAFGEEKAWGLHYEFETVEYKSSANKTIDSRYCVLDKDNGTIIARNVDTTVEGGKTMDTQSETSVDREPLVRVKLMQGSEVILDGYILVRITRQAKETQDLTIEEYAGLGWSKTFDNCNLMTFGYTTWDQFSKWVLTDEMKDMTKEDFDAAYTIDGTVSTTPGTDTKIYSCVVYADNNGTKKVYKNKAGVNLQLGTIYMRNDAEGINNHAFQLVLSEDEIEAITHDKQLPVTETFYVRFNGAVAAQYKNIWVKFQVTLDRMVEETAIKTKGDNYWFGLDGNADGWDAMAFNVDFPANNTSCGVWSSKTLTSFEKNRTYFTNNKFNTGSYNSNANSFSVKFFFVPNNTRITDLHGNVWIVTPRTGCNDQKWNSLNCEKDVLHERNTAKAHKWALRGADAYSVAASTDVEKNHETFVKCAIDYNDGAFENYALYAVKQSAYNTQTEYTKIAEMLPATGEIKLVRDWNGNTVLCCQEEPLDMILNAIKYEENHANISTEMHAWVGLAVNNGCDVVVDAYTMENVDNNKNFAIWEASWQRPINMNNAKPVEFEDANDNGSYFPVYKTLSFFDWRNESMETKENKWLWAYYNINRIVVDCDPAHVTTDLFGGKLGETKLSEKSSLVHLFVAETAVAGAPKFVSKEFAVDLSAYNSSLKSELLATYLSVHQNKYGYIYYENNGLNVTTFTVRIPVKVYYEWGHFDTYVDVQIHTTQGN